MGAVLPSASSVPFSRTAGQGRGRFEMRQAHGSRPGQQGNTTGGAGWLRGALLPPAWHAQRAQQRSPSSVPFTTPIATVEAPRRNSAAPSAKLACKVIPQHASMDHAVVAQVGEARRDRQSVESVGRCTLHLPPPPLVPACPLPSLLHRRAAAYTAQGSQLTLGCCFSQPASV